MNYEFDPDNPPELGVLAACGKGEACAVCRIFGYVTDDSGWAAKVRFHDSTPLANWNDARWVPMGSGKARMPAHGPKRTSFYGPSSAPAGWKFYLHAKALTGSNEQFRSDDCVPAGSTFMFRVDYAGLTEEEYALLRFGLCLQGSKLQLHHKVGYAKPLGYGSCLVELVEGGEACHFDLSAYLDDRGPFRVISKYCDFKKAADELLYPGGTWLLDNPTGTIADYELWLNGPEPPPPPPPPPSGRVKVRVTSCVGVIVKAETEQTYGEPPRKYRTTFKVTSTFNRPKKDDLIDVEVLKVTEKDFSFGASYL
jgi:hypothetical protein